MALGIAQLRQDHLLRPFAYVAGWPSLLLGLAILLLTSSMAYLGHVRFDGVLDLHLIRSTAGTGFSVFLAEQVLNWLSLSAVLILIGISLRKDFRVTDLLGTQAVARYPALLVAALALIMPTTDVTRYVAYQFLGVGEPVQLSILSIIAFGVFLLLSLVLMCYMYYLMYRAFRVSTGIGGPKGIILFLTGLLVAEVISKAVLLSDLFQGI